MEQVIKAWATHIWVEQPEGKRGPRTNSW